MGLFNMYQWMIPVSKFQENPHFCTKQADINILFDKNLKETLTSICQFFAYSSYILQTDVYISIPTPTKETENLVFEHLTPYYKRIIITSIEGKTCECSLIGLKPETIALFQEFERSNELSSILPDLVRKTHIKQLDENYFKNANIKVYAIDMTALKPLNLAFTESLYPFLKQTFFAVGGVMPIQPIGWKLHNDLIESIFLRSFSTIASKIHITVNLTNGDILGVDVFENKKR